MLLLLGIIMSISDMQDSSYAKEVMGLKLRTTAIDS